MASGLGRRAEIPILPIFDLVPPPRLLPKTNFFFKTPTSPTKDGARSRLLDRPAQPMQATLRNRRENSLRQGSYFLIRPTRTTVLSFPLLSPSLLVSSFLPLGQGDLDGGVECPAREVSGDCLWRYPWPIRASRSCSTAHTE